jgi:hypothetical protein
MRKSSHMKLRHLLFALIVIATPEIASACEMYGCGNGSICLALSYALNTTAGQITFWACLIAAIIIARLKKIRVWKIAISAIIVLFIYGFLRIQQALGC